MILNAAAKVNLMLDILGRTKEGYHTLFMIMQSVGIQDTVTINRTGDKGAIVLTCDRADIPTDGTNIAWKAAERFFTATGLENPGISIDIQKRIPSAAGLAGGSADGAAVFVGLNTLFGTGLDERDLCRMAEPVGADIPFCIQGGTMLAMDIGGVLAPLPDLPDCWFVLVKPDMDVSTKEAYAEADRNFRHLRHLDTSDMLRALVTGDQKEIFRLVGNVFEQVIEVPDRVDIKAIMRGTGAETSCMSGSGPTIYGIFTSKEDAEQCRQMLEKHKLGEVFLCQPLHRGIEVVEA
ncbi:MAG: 4-(cytidine 5'-diphospho)-2-C-methyl-D-erythritol kinase [Oscillospiraceae bacterium]|nr:4-(cytidine 5'-diphospho)-2-C-methyl-D-erythritol kinase [Oscillospiraceae bacterium]